MKISKYQSGAAFTTPFATQNQALQHQKFVGERQIFGVGAEEKTTKKTAKVDSLIDETLLGKITSTGLQNEVEALIQTKTQVEMNIQNGTQTAAEINRLGVLTNRVARNSKESENVEKDILEHKSGDDFYYDNYNRVAVKDKTGILSFISVNDYYKALTDSMTKKEPMKYNLMTNNQVHYDRIHSSDKAFNEDIFHNLLQAPTKEGFATSVKQVLDDLSTGKLKEVSPILKQQYEDFRTAVEENNIQAIRKIESDKNFNNGIMSLVKSKVSDRLYNYMSFRQARENSTLGTFVMQMIDEKLGVTGVTGDGSGASSGASGTVHAKTQASDVARRLGQKATSIINPGDKSQMVLHGFRYNNLQNNKVSPDNAPIKQSTMYKALIDSGLYNMIDANGCFIGNHKIDQTNYTEDLKSLLYNGGDFIEAEMPVNGNGDIDFELYDIVNKLLDSDKDEKELNEEITKMQAQNPNRDYGHFYLNNGTITWGSNSGRTASYLVFTAHSFGDMNKVMQDNKFALELEGPKKDSIKATYNTISKNGSVTKVNDDDAPEKHFWHNNAYAAPLFLKKTDNASTEVNHYGATRIDGYNKISKEIQKKTIKKNTGLNN